MKINPNPLREYKDRTSSRQVYTNINNISKYLTEILNTLDNNHNLSDIQRFYDNYLECFVEDYHTLGKHEAIGNKRGSTAMHIFVELSRACFILKYRQLMKEKQMVINHVEQTDQLLVVFSLKKCKSDFWYSDNDKNIFVYNQDEIIDLLLLLTKRIVEMPYNQSTLSDFKRIILALFTRNSVFFCQTCSETALNVEDMRSKYSDNEYIFNRDYAMFCTIYFNQLFRRLHYYKQIEKNINNPLDIDCTSVKQWVRSELCDALGVEGVEDTYALACDQTYDYPGDDEWFKYKFVERAAEKGSILDCIRPAQAQLYFSPNVISLDPILNAADGFRADQQGVMARLFVLMAVDQRFRSVYGIPWLQCVLVKNHQIEYSRIKLQKHHFPCLVQVLCGFWVYTKGQFYPTNNIYKTIYTWFYILRRDYNCKLLRIDLSEQTKKLLDSPEQNKGIFLI